jgi:hypothetical protein
MCDTMGECEAITPTQLHGAYMHRTMVIRNGENGMYDVEIHGEDKNGEDECILVIHVESWLMEIPGFIINKK